MTAKKESKEPSARSVVREAIKQAGETKPAMWEDLARARQMRRNGSTTVKEPGRSAGEPANRRSGNAPSSQ